MARGIFGCKFSVAAGLLAAFVLVGTTTPAQAQLFQLFSRTRTPSVREMMAKARQAFERGDFAEASTYYAKVRQSEIKQPQLSQDELRDLAAQIRQNNTALQTQQQGQMQLKQVQAALNKGLRRQARALLRAVAPNPFLAPEDKQLLGQLQARLDGTPSAAGRDNNPAGTKPLVKLPENYKGLMKAARDALTKNDLKTAEELAKRAQKANKSVVPSWLQAPWNDTPERILSDVRAARVRAESVDGAKKGQRAKTNFSPLQAVRDLFPWRKKNANDSNDDGKPNGIGRPMPPGPKVVRTGFKKKPPPGGNQAPVGDANTEKARALLKEGFSALQKGDFGRARRLAEQAKKLQPKLQPWEKTPEHLLVEVERVQPELAISGQPSPPDGKGQIFDAGTPTDPRELLRLGRKLYEEGKLNEAEKYCTRAEIAPGANWGLFEDTPNKLRANIRAARQQRDRAEAKRLLADARKLFRQGQLKEAKNLTYKAEKLHGPYGMWEFGDRPDKLRAEIVAAEMQRKGNSVPPIPGGGITPPLPPLTPGTGEKPDPNPAAPNTEQTLARQKVLALLREARQLQMQNRLIDARAKALEAKKAWDDGRRFGILFAPGEDNPGWALTQLNGQSVQTIQQLMLQADRTAAAMGDPKRFETAAGMLEQAKQLAAAYQFPVNPIDEKLTWLAQQAAAQGVTLKTGVTPEQPGNAAPLTKDEKLGKKLIRDAWASIRDNNLSVAKEIIREILSNEKYGGHDDALAVQRYIDAEMFKRRVVEANKAARAVRDAYVRGQHKEAWMIAQGVDEKLLTPENRTNLQEILTMPEMQQVAEGGADPAGQATITDQKPNPLSPGPKAGGVADRVVKRERILFDKFKQERAAVMEKARDALANGDHTGSLELLREFNLRVSEANLSADRAAYLQRPVRQRLQQFKVYIANQELQRERLEAIKNRKPHREQVRQASITKRDNEIAELIKQAQEMYRNGKYKKARLLAKQAQDLDPDNLAANATLTMVSIKRNLSEFKKGEAAKQQYLLDELEFKDWPTLDPHRNPLELDPERTRIARKRKNPARGFGINRLTPKEQEIERKLETPINLNFKDTPLSQVLKDIRYFGGFNVMVDNAALKEAGISLEQPLSLQAENMSIKSVLYHLLNDARLTWVIKSEALVITTENYAKGKLVQRVYPVADLVIPVRDAIPQPMTTLADLLNNANRTNQYYGQRVYTAPYMLPGARPVSSFNGPQGSAFGTAGGANMAGQNGFAMGGQGGQWNVSSSQRTIHEELIKLITSTVSPDSWNEVGGKGRIQYFPLGYGLVVNQTQDIQEQIADLLQALRRLQELEVAIEIRLIAVSETFFERIGVDFDVILTTDQGRFEPQIVTQQFVPGARINRFLPDGFMSGLTPAGTFTPDLNIPLNSSSVDFTVPPIGGFPGALGANGGLSLGLAFLSDIQVFMFMEAAQGDRRAAATQAPRITVFNGQLASLTVADQLPFLVNIAPAFAGDQLFFIPTQVALPLFTTINVQPVVSADRRFVRMAVTQAMQNLVSTNVPLIPIQVPIFPQFQDGVVGNQPTIFQIFLQQPATSLISVTTTVSVPDGGTVLLGGLKTFHETRLEFGPPVLSKIPYISRLFRNVGYGREATSLMMMITPRIIITEEEELIYLGKMEPIPRP